MDKDCKGIRTLDLSGNLIFRRFGDFHGIDLAFSLWDLVLYDCAVMRHEI